MNENKTKDRFGLMTRKKIQRLFAAQKPDGKNCRLK
jgi:hypothetical protein